MKHILIAVLASCSLFVLGCGGGSFSRGIFESKVTSQSEEEVLKRVGKPDAVENPSDKTRKYTYKGRTFDTNENGQKDNEAVILFEKNASGNYVVANVYFS